MGIVKLTGLEFFAYHGYYDEEQRIGNKYSVSISIDADLEQAAEQDRLAMTIDYEQVYLATRAVMEQPARLLERLAARIIDKVYEKYPYITACEVSVSKFNPPVGGICEAATVTLRR
jgi:7,8-dihydroneopterin aldolase/epimerase/oxygenase